MYHEVMDTKETKFAEGDVVTTTAFSPALQGLEGVLVPTTEEGRIFLWRLVLTRASQAAYLNTPVGAIVPGSLYEADRLNGWLVREDEIQKVEA